MTKRQLHLPMVEVEKVVKERNIKAGAPRVSGIGWIKNESKILRPDYYREQDRERGKARYERRRPWLVAIKSAMSCQVCGASGSTASLDFHHINPNEKLFEPSLRNLKRNQQSFLNELAKCAAVCVSCHRSLHHDSEGDIELTTIDVDSLPPMPY